MNIGRERLAHERVTRVTGEDVKGWLQIEYVDKLRSVRDIAREVYGYEKNSSSVLDLLKRYGIETRKGGDAVRTQWINNDERREQKAKFIKGKITGKIREAIIEKMQTDEYKEKQRISKTGERNGMHGVFGENHPQWNPERTHEQRVMERKTRFDKPWRMAVFARDGFTCQLCGDKTRGNLNAHHLDSYHENKDERYSVVNGVTLCNSCHTEYHRLYGWNDATRQKFEAFVASKGKQTA
jgi:5-methylcytosine-specific restriction endonuclease McrA